LSNLSIQDCAGMIARDIRAVQPNGPYYIAGHSFGGVAALEIALRLQALGQQVNFLGMLDTSGPRDPIDSTQADLMRRALYRFKTFRFLPPREKLEYLGRRLDDFRVRALRRLSRVPQPPPLTPLHWMVDYFNALTRTSETADYTPGVFDGCITYFICDASTEPHDYDWRMGWHRHATGGFRVVRVPGDHGSMLEEPAVHAVVCKFEEELRQSRRRHQRAAAHPARAGDCLRPSARGERALSGAGGNGQHPMANSDEDLGLRQVDFLSDEGPEEHVLQR